MRSISALVLPAVLLVTSLGAGPATAQSPPQAEVAKRFSGLALRQGHGSNEAQGGPRRQSQGHDLLRPEQAP
jgi:hypothetical protein